MKRIILAALATLALAGCGGTAKIGGGKEGVAQAFFSAAQATSAAGKSTQPIDITGSVTHKCPEGGEAAIQGFKLKVDGSGSGANVQSDFTVKYTNCGAAKSDVGVAIYNGGFTVNQAVVTTNSSASVLQTFKGRVEVGGAFNDFLEADIKQEVLASGLSGTDGMVKAKLVGIIKTSTESFTYNEDINVQPGGKITVASTRM